MYLWLFSYGIADSIQAQYLVGEISRTLIIKHTDNAFKLVDCESLRFNANFILIHREQLLVLPSLNFCPLLSIGIIQID